MNRKIILYFALMILGLYVMPNTVSLLAGQHTFYISVSCEKCHTDVLSEVEHSGYVYEKHKAAAGNANYTSYLSIGGISYNGNSITDYNNIVWNWNISERKWQNSSNLNILVNVSLDANRNGQIDSSEICMLCHNATLINATTHTGITVITCDDDRCHGNRIYSDNSPQILGSFLNITAAGYNLSQSNAHQPFYLQASNQSSGYGISQPFGRTPGNANGSSRFISRGYWTCEGCHTDTTVNITILPPQPFNHSVSNPEKKRYLP